MAAECEETLPYLRWFCTSIDPPLSQLFHFSRLVVGGYVINGATPRLDFNKLKVYDFDKLKVYV